jgi:3-hydroxyisobutyrate dehydrogenase-like beta-hydroxyacid dehydrogenase
MRTAGALRLPACLLEEGRRLPVSLPSAATEDQMLTVARAMGYGECDPAGLFELMARGLA